MGSLIARTTLADGQVILTSATGYTNSVDFSRCAGEAAVLIKTLLGGCSITQQCSYDNVNWFDPVDAAGGALGVVIASIAATTGKYITYTPVLTPFIRFVVIEDGSNDLTLTLYLIFREEA
jgi:hypothetical protein